MSNQLRVANAPCSWGALEFNWAGQMPPYETVLDEMTSTGYAGTELGGWGFMPTEPEALSDELSRRESGADRRVRAGCSSPWTRNTLPGSRMRSASRDCSQSTAGSNALVVLSDATAHDPKRTAIAGRVTPEDGLTAGGVGHAGPWRQSDRTRGERGDWPANGVSSSLRDVRRDAARDRRADDAHGSRARRTLPRHRTLRVRRRQSCGDARTLAVARLARPPEGLRPAIKARARREEWDYQRSIREGVFCELGKGEVDFRRRPLVASSRRAIRAGSWSNRMSSRRSAPRSKARARNRELSPHAWVVADSAYVEPEPEDRGPNQPRTANPEPRTHLCMLSPASWPRRRCWVGVVIGASAASTSASGSRSSRSRGAWRGTAASRVGRRRSFVAA